MKIGVFTVLFQDLPFEQMLDKVASFGIQSVELGTGFYPGTSHCDPAFLLENENEIFKLKQIIQDKGLTISGLSFHGNPLHPNKEIARQSHESWRKTVELAAKLDVSVVNGFAGCPGDHPGAKFPNWVTCSWPPEYLEVLEWQWNEVVIPYWKEEAKFATDHGINKIGFEMHPGFVVYNPETLLKLRNAVGPMIGANYDPSHLVWQGIDPVESIKLLGRENAIFHVHAKDTYLDHENIKKNGVLDTKHYSEVLDRAWTFRTVGYGSDEKMWKDIVSALRAINYDDVLSIEHEDILASTDEGLGKAVKLLKNVIFEEKQTGMWWA
ncbi:sugar phosphate isomerase/epimerase family protein [Halalkalibacter nanhaiisediminis]|uniref:Sugar phosphate isomerase/epimerase n=1 Tax=Halalkalibacter nanhaiisediminis TaxID=688079 RepID=A0A562Q993_9BACI|nr:sugar phosphate isomerase/epimerase [Halalkalibacter nanhaiisediminis]TWI53264.1 sugar phosphate isomerase/epimerase [Halalkalibacter nanhaiisediminis]